MKCRCRRRDTKHSTRMFPGPPGCRYRRPSGRSFPKEGRTFDSDQDTGKDCGCTGRPVNCTYQWYSRYCRCNSLLSRPDSYCSRIFQFRCRHCYRHTRCRSYRSSWTRRHPWPDSTRFPDCRRIVWATSQHKIGRGDKRKECRHSFPGCKRPRRRNSRDCNHN